MNIDTDSVSDMWREFHKDRQEHRAANREMSARALTEAKVQFESKNFGAHLIVTVEKEVIDFWPGTGKFIVRETGDVGRGVFSLLKRLGITKLKTSKGKS